jgi:glycosyltransferase involved in cell wall biosynthesis
VTPRFSIIIPAFNEEFELPATLRAFERAVSNYQAQYPAHSVEIIVVDNNSTDSTPVIARRLGATVIHEPHRQIARSRNTGARAAAGKFLVTCDADSRPHPQILLKIESELSRNCFAGGVRIWASPLKLTQFPIFLLVNLVCVVGRLPAGMFFMKRQDFLEMGGFDESLYALEDVDLARRLRKEARWRGMRIAILWNHPILTSTRKFRVSRFRDWFRMGLLAALFPKKYLKQRRHWEDLYYSPSLREREGVDS